MTARLKLKRIYATPVADDGVRVLVERLWPRGLSKERAAVDLWLKDLAPSTELRRWFGHDPANWPRFCWRYWAELGGQSDLVNLLQGKGEEGTITLLFAARDERHNNALALKLFLEGAGIPDPGTGAMGRKELWLAAMSGYFGADTRRIDHALRVLEFAEEIAAGEKVPPGTAEVVTAAAIFHDIGITEAERKYGSPAAKYQEIEGPPIARGLLRAAGEGAAFIDRVCYIVGHHHTREQVDGMDFQILWEADLLVNLLTGKSGGAAGNRAAIIEQNFLTRSGRVLAGRVLATR